LQKEYLFSDIYANPIAGVILKNILEPNPELRFIGANTTVLYLPIKANWQALQEATVRQPVHADMNHEHLDIPFAMTVNIPLVDISSKNGGTEYWLGTHQQGNKGLTKKEGDPFVAEKYLDERRKLSPPTCPSVSKGSLIIRDMRLWHAASPNQTPEPRIMLCLVLLVLA
jgi:ectoine hydroxylase-related dioxygenase (phytanoyl-CoA dioxygenase family)